MSSTSLEKTPHRRPTSSAIVPSLPTDWTCEENMHRAKFWRRSQLWVRKSTHRPYLCVYHHWKNRGRRLPRYHGHRSGERKSTECVYRPWSRGKVSMSAGCLLGDCSGGQSQPFFEGRRREAPGFKGCRQTWGFQRLREASEQGKEYLQVSGFIDRQWGGGWSCWTDLAAVKRNIGLDFASTQMATSKEEA